MEKKNYEQSKKLDNVCYDIRGPVMDEDSVRAFSPGRSGMASKRNALRLAPTAFSLHANAARTLSRQSVFLWIEWSLPPFPPNVKRK